MTAGRTNVTAALAHLDTTLGSREAVLPSSPKSLGCGKCGADRFHPCRRANPATGRIEYKKGVHPERRRAFIDAIRPSTATEDAA